MAVAGSPGWSETGGPWVPPSQGMKKYVWSETVLEGGKPFEGKIAHPPIVTGAFQNMGIREQFGRPQGPPHPEFYADAAVVAFRVPSNESGKEVVAHAKITGKWRRVGPCDIE